MKPDYSRALPEGASALRKVVDPAAMPDLAGAFEARDGSLTEALDNSLRWFELPSTGQFFPLQPEGISHDQAKASVWAIKNLLATSATGADFQRRVQQECDVWMSVGWNDQGVVLFTGYYTPVFSASRVRTDEYRYPLYQAPADLVIDKASGAIRGRDLGQGRIETYPTRAQIEYYPQLLGLAGHELVWMKDKFDAYIVEVQGSAQLELTDGTKMNVGYAGCNGLDYVSINKALVADGKLDPDHANLKTMAAYFKDHPGQVDYYLWQNPRYVFFQEYNNPQWPAGSLGFRVTPVRSLATDKRIFPRGCVTVVATNTPQAGVAPKVAAESFAFHQLMLDQDTGGAIRAPGRADIYYGIGPAAGDSAGLQFAEGRLYYLLLKPERVGYWQAQMAQAAPAPAPAHPGKAKPALH
jgi:membrane-bound lytic murein transglycosylase A